MTDSLTLVTIEHNVPLADSREIAAKLGIDHDNFFAQIKKYQEEVEADFGLILFQTGAVKTETSRGTKHTQYAMLTETQANTYMAYSQNTDQARACKRLLVKAFDEAKQRIRKLEQVIQLQNAEDHKSIPPHMIDEMERHFRTMADIEKEVRALIEAAKAAKRLTSGQLEEISSALARLRRTIQPALVTIQAHEEALLEFDTKMIVIFSGEHAK